MCARSSLAAALGISSKLYSSSCCCLFSYSLGGSTAQPLGGGPTSPDIHPPSFIDATQNSSNDIETKHAKVLYDYDAADMSELSLKADEVCL